MPMYEYKCETCGHRFDMIKKMSDPNPPCPKAPESPIMEVGSEEVVDTVKGKACGGETKKMISTGGSFHLKGSGWASDGYS